MLVMWQEQAAGYAAMGEVHLPQAGKRRETSRATSGKERGRANGQQMQLLGNAEKAGSIWSNKLRMKLGSRHRLEKTQ